MIRIATLNMNHRINAIPVPDLFFDIIMDLSPDVLILTEYVHGRNSRNFACRMNAIGFYFHCSNYVPGQNQVLIASKGEMHIGGMSVQCGDPCDPPNFLHVRTLDMDIFGVRMPIPKNAAKKREYWLHITNKLLNTNGPAILMGDFNMDFWRRQRSAGCQQIHALLANGWQSKNPNPLSAGSYIGSRRNGTGERALSRLDHFVASNHFRVCSAMYLQEVSGIPIVGEESGSFTDHAILSVDLDLNH